ncbi:hypothetical protein QTP86_000887 [Hemibagrus guttatus]|nr:hypothetical protein QTP86_000887 [Hemibagrus guttatus]
MCCLRIGVSKSSVVCECEKINAPEKYLQNRPCFTNSLEPKFLQLDTSTGTISLPLQELPCLSENLDGSLLCMSQSKAKKRPCAYGDGLQAENTPHELIQHWSPPRKQPRPCAKGKENGFVLARRPRRSRDMTGILCWDTLPDELLLGIFSRLSLQDLLRTSRVCKRWHRLALLRVQHLDLSSCTVQTPVLEDILSRCRRLQNLSVEGLVLSDSILRLEELNVSWCDFSSEHVQAVVNNIPTTITQLNISGYRQNFTMDNVKVLVERCPNITHLDLREFEKFETLQTLDVFGLIQDSSLPILSKGLPRIQINTQPFSGVARPTAATRKDRTLWGMHCRLVYKP